MIKITSNFSNANSVIGYQAGVAAAIPGWRVCSPTRGLVKNITKKRNTLFRFDNLSSLDRRYCHFPCIGIFCCTDNDKSNNYWAVKGIRLRDRQTIFFSVALQKRSLSYTE